MWHRFTEEARKAVFYAQEEATRFSQGYVSTEHLLLGLAREGDTGASRVFEKLGVSVTRIRAEVEKKLEPASSGPNRGMTLTSRAKLAIDNAHTYAKALTHKYISTEHLLLGLIHDKEGLAGEVLIQLGVDFETAQSAVVEIGNSQKNPTGSQPREDSLTRAHLSSEAYGFTLGYLVLEHLLFLALSSDDSIANRAIRNAIGDTGLLHVEIWAHFNRRCFRDVFPVGSEELELLLQQAFAEAMSRGEARVELHHLILAASRIENTSLAQILQRAGLTYDKLRDEVEKLLEDSGSADPAKPS